MHVTNLRVMSQTKAEITIKTSYVDAGILTLA